MKKIIRTLILSLVIQSSARGASILSSDLVVVDYYAGLIGTFSLESLLGPTPKWLNTNTYGWEYNGHGYHGLGGGAITVQTLPHEVITNVDIYFSVGATGIAPWNFVFDSYGTEPGVQIWKSDNPPSGYGIPGPGWTLPGFGFNMLAPLYFEVQSDLQTTGNQYYLMSSVPEPTFGGVIAISFILSLGYRSRPRNCS